MISKINILELSDVHLGHRTTETLHIVNNLKSLLRDKEQMAGVDLIIIAGDLFDRLLNLTSGDVYIIHNFFYYLLTLCVKHDILLRVLEGTPSHDNKQNRLLVEINEESGLGCDLVYFDSLDIEYIERFDIHVLYIPDEWHPDCNHTLLEAREAIIKRGLSQVDFAVMHGQFDYQVPPPLLNRIPHHNSAAYLELVKYLIFIGHVHQHSQYKRIIAAGSTDRLRHGEEESKGLIYAEVYATGDFTAKFIVNHNAKIYKTIDLTNMELSKALKVVEKEVNEVPENSYIRIRTSREDSVLNSVKELKSEYPQINWSVITDKSVESKAHVVLEKPQVMMDNLHEDTIAKLLEKRMEGRYEASQIKHSLKLIEEIIHGVGD